VNNAGFRASSPILYGEWEIELRYKEKDDINIFIFVNWMDLTLLAMKVYFSQCLFSKSIFVYYIADIYSWEIIGLKRDCEGKGN